MIKQFMSNPLLRAALAWLVFFALYHWAFGGSALSAALIGLIAIAFVFGFSYYTMKKIDTDDRHSDRDSHET